MERNSEVDREILEIAKKNGKFQAVKHCKDKYAIDLKQAKTITDEIVKGTKLPVSKSNKIGCTVILILAVLIGLLIGLGTCNDKNNKQAPKVLTRLDSIKTQFDTITGECIPVFNKLNTELNDPHSYEHIQTKYIDFREHQEVIETLRGVHPSWFKPNGILDKNSNAIYIITNFRAKNAFGALIKGSVDAVIGIDGNLIYFSDLSDTNE
jgi:hypothetical protein